MKQAITFIMFCLWGVTATLSAHGEELKIGAGAAPTENILKPIKEAFERGTGIKLFIISSGPKNAFVELDRGQVDAAAAGLNFEEWMELMKKEGYEVKDPSLFKPITIGKDKIIVILHRDNPVDRLSKEQLKAIFTGNIDNWKSVGGADLPIIVVWGSLIPGTNSMFVKNMLDGQPVRPEVLGATTAEDVRLNVSANREAIGIGPMALIDPTVKSPETPELSRDIVIMTKGEPSAAVLKLINFIRTEGPKYIK